ncbi:MAG: ATP-binding protein [Actinobacteria bacterium]|nr:ATP-binding protein [Actinomycetota bacterium]
MVFEKDVDAIAEDRFGALWVGTDGGGLRRFDRETQTFITFRHDPGDPSSLSHDNIQAIHEDRQGTLWIGTLGGGLNKMSREEGTFLHYSHVPGDTTSLSHDLVGGGAIFEDRQGTLWIGTLGGLNRFNRESDTFTLFLDRQTNATTIYEDRLGRFWVGSEESGLHLLDRETGASIAFTVEDGLQSNTVRAILEDDAGHLWLSTDIGLSQFDPETQTFRNFDVTDGLFSEFLWGSAFRSRSGELFFGGLYGFISFYPNQIEIDETPPEVILTGLRIFNEPVRPGLDAPLKQPIWDAEEIVLEHDQHALTFDYVGFHYKDPAKNQYQYKLEGYDDEWIDVGSQRSARYTELPHGAYVFRVKAANADGVWSDGSTSVRITIHPPWWGTTWAYLVYGLLFIAGVVAVDRIQRRRLIRKERERAMQRELQQARRIEAMNRQLREHEQLLEDQNRKLLELDELKSRFFANISHEFRTPLTLILGPLKDLLDEAFGSLREAQRAQLTLVQRNGRRLLRLINQLLDLSRLEAGHLTLRARQANLIPFIKATTQAFASMARRKQITLQVDVPQQEILLYFEPDKLEKILYNLLSNAFKFTPEQGAIVIRVEEGKSETGGFTTSVASGSCVEILVKDTGRGIPADALPFIFDRFHQVDASSTREQEGTGIGLALTKELVALHGGTIRVESTVGVGSTFFVRLPRGRAHLNDEDIVDAEGSDDILEPPGARHTLDAVDDILVSEERLYTGGGQGGGIPPKDVPVILIVEDNDDVRGYLRSHLAADYRIVEAVDGVEGLEQARTLEPALVLSDVMMPRMDGYALCRAIKTDEKLNHIPVVLLTAKADDESKIEGLETGADDYLYKPFNAEELLVRVENLIEIRRQLRARFSEEVRLGPSEVVVSSQEAAFVEQVRAVVEAELSNSQLTMEQVAEAVGLGLRQLHRRLKAAAGLTPGGYVRMLRLARAAQLLAQETGNVSEVAYAVGFNDVDYFSRLFKQTHGVPPSQYGKG